jgi:hypothetical protein
MPHSNDDLPIGPDDKSETPAHEAPKVDAPAAAPASRGLKKPLFIGAISVGIGLWLVLALLPGFLSRGAQVAPVAPPADETAIRRIGATLFYVSEDGAELVPVMREVLYGATPTEQAKRIVEAQVAAPTDGQVSAIPAGTTVRSVFLGTHGDAYVDLSAYATTGHTGGTLDEALAVFAIVNAITSNLREISSVQILVDGKEVDSLAGHLDLRQPIARASDWIRKGQ